MLFTWFIRATTTAAAVLVVFLAVLLFAPDHSSTLSEYNLHSLSVLVPPVNVSAVAHEVSALVKLDTISCDEEPSRLSPRSQEQMKAAHALLRRFYPTLFSKASVETIDEFSLLIRLPGSDPSLRPALVMCHLDVVSIEEGTEANWGAKDSCKECGPFSGAQVGGYVWGRGSMDMKSTCVSFLHAAENLLTSERVFSPQRALYFAIGHDEEMRGHGHAAIAARLAADGVQLEAVLDEGNPTLARGSTAMNRDFDLAMPALAEKGYLSVELSVSAAGGHAAMPPIEGTPIAILADAVRRVQASQPLPALRRPVTDMFDAVAPCLPQPLRFVLARHRLLAPIVAYGLSLAPRTAAQVRTTTAATVFRAGDKDNVVPQRAAAIINHRILHGDTVAATLERDTRAVNDPRVTIRALPYSFEPTVLTEPDSLVFRVVAGAIRSVMPAAVIAPGLFNAASDSRHYDAVAGGRIIKYFPFKWNNDDLATIHGTDERIRIESLGTAVKFYTYFLLAMARPAEDLRLIPFRNPPGPL